jgi:hypothetical protein
VNNAQDRRALRERLSMEDRHTLETRVLPTAQRWLREGFQVDHAMSTLDYWGEPYTKPEGRQ